MLVDCDCDEEPAQRDPCPVEALSRQANELIKAYDAADRAALTNVGVTGTELALWSDRITRSLDDVETQATELKAASATGTLFKVHLTAALADRVASWPYEGTVEYRAAQKDLIAILKLLYSIADYIETMSGSSLERACGEYYMPKRADPHRAHPQ